MDIKNYFLKKKQLKAIKNTKMDIVFFQCKYNCPKCYWRTDTLEPYIKHLENHLTKKKRQKNELS